MELNDLIPLHRVPDPVQVEKEAHLAALTNGHEMTTLSKTFQKSKTLIPTNAT